MIAYRRFNAWSKHRRCPTPPPLPASPASRASMIAGRRSTTSYSVGSSTCHGAQRSRPRIGAMPRAALGRPPLLPPQPHQPELHLVSALSFLVRLRLLFVDPPLAALLGWLRVDDDAPGRPLLLRAQGLRPRQPGHARAQGGDQGRLQPAPQGGADGAGLRCRWRWLPAPTCSACWSSRHRLAGYAARRRLPGWRSGVAGCCSARCSCSAADLQTGLVWARRS
jgi:hypothetical protein